MNLVADYITNPCADSLALSQPSVIGGQQVTATVTLTRPAPYNGAWVLIYSESALLSNLPPAVFVPEGETSVTFTVYTGYSGVDAAATIYSVFNGTTESVMLEILSYLPNAVWEQDRKLGITPAAATALYTVPSNKKAIIDEVIVNNDTGGTITMTFDLLRGGNAFNIVAFSSGPNFSVLAGGSTVIKLNGLVYEAGDVIRITPSATGLNVQVAVLVFESSSPFKTTIISTLLGTLANGNNTVYTCPALNRARICAPVNLLTLTFGNAGMVYSNNSGGTRTYIVYNVPSGGATSTQNRTTGAGPTLANGVGTAAILTGDALDAGDFVVLNVNAGTATQSAAITTLTLPV